MLKITLVSIIAIFGFSYASETLEPFQQALSVVTGNQAESNQAGTFEFGNGETVDSYLNDSTYFSYGGN